MTATINASTSSGVIVTSDTSGSLAIQSNGTTIATAGSTGLTISSYTAGASLLTSGTAQNSTSGTSIDFTSIPSWVKRITVMLKSVSTNGTSVPTIRLGTGGVAATTGYSTQSSVIAAASVGTINSTGGYDIYSNAASYALNGSVQFTNLSGNNWVGAGVLSFDGVAGTLTIAGYVGLSGVLDMVRITTAAGTDTFDTGSINILYE